MTVSFAEELHAEEVQLEDMAPEFSEEAMALIFADRHASHLRYVSKWGRWKKYDGQRWVDDERLEVYDFARIICREVAQDAEANQRRFARVIANAKTRAAVVSLASNDQRLAAVVSQWDADPWLLNTPSGAIDLYTGALRPHSPDTYMTKMTAVAPDSNCPTPLWLAFLDRSTGGSADMQRFLQRIGGYALTGVTRDHAMFFLYGLGANGKSVFISTIAGIMADYHQTAPIETFTASNNDRHPTDLAGLHGARLVTAIETEEGRPWAEAKIKSITGGDRISARFMRQDFFEFIPQFKLLVAGNHRPGLRSVDEAMKRRINLIPFTVIIPSNERDPELPTKLKEEWSGILDWLLKGCAEWQRIGLAAPKVVVDATEEYLTSENTFQSWLDECCIQSANNFEKVSLLFARWQHWAEGSGEYVGTKRRFSARLEAHGFERKKGTAGVREYVGLKLDPKWQRPM